MAFGGRFSPDRMAHCVEYLQQRLSFQVVAEKNAVQIGYVIGQYYVISPSEIFEKHGHRVSKPLKTHFQTVVIVGIGMRNRVEIGIGLVLGEASTDAGKVVYLLEVQVVLGPIHLGAIALISTLDHPFQKHPVGLLYGAERLKDRVRLLPQHHQRNENKQKNEGFSHIKHQNNGQNRPML